MLSEKFTHILHFWAFANQKVICWLCLVVHPAAASLRLRPIKRLFLLRHTPCVSCAVASSFRSASDWVLLLCLCDVSFAPLISRSDPLAEENVLSAHNFVISVCRDNQLSQWRPLPVCLPFLSDENKEPNSFFVAESETSAPDYWRENSGEETNTRSCFCGCKAAQQLNQWGQNSRKC